MSPFNQCQDGSPLHCYRCFPISPFLSSLAQSTLSPSAAAAHVFSFRRMNHESPDKEKDSNQTRECCGKGAWEFKAGRNRVSDRLMSHILNLYWSRATARDFEIYAADASFEDPLMCAHGVKHIKWDKKPLKNRDTGLSTGGQTH